MAKLRNPGSFWPLLVFVLAVLIRITPSLKYGLSYGFDIYEFVSRVFLLNEGEPVSLPHGPLFYYFQLTILKIAGYEAFFKILTFLEPIVFTLFILPPYFISRGLKTVNNEPIYTLLYLAVTNLLVHQIGSVIIPEGLGIFFFGLSTFFAMKALEDRKWMLLAMFSGFLTVMSHHLSAFQLILFFMSLFSSYLYYYARYERRGDSLSMLILLLITAVLLPVSSILAWSLFGGEENMLKLFLDMVIHNHILLILLLGGSLLFPILTVESTKFLRKYGKFTFKKTFISMLLIGIFIPSILTIILYPEALPTILWFTVPISTGFLPFAIYGIIKYCKESTISNSIFFLAPLTIFMVEAFSLLSLSNYKVLIHRLPTFVIYFATPLAGYGLSCFSKELSDLKKEYLAGMIIAYVIFSLAFTSFPKPEFAYGVKESISYSEFRLTRDAYEYSRLFNAEIDTDTRLGALLMFVSSRRAAWMGNLTSWFLPSNSWLVNVSITGKPYMLEDKIILVISNSMRGNYYGRFINLITKPSGPIGEEVINYLNNCPGVDRLEDVGEGVLYMKSPWKELNHHGTG
jgi:hypothetical protein